jgi:hypothetical protein
MFGDTGVSAEGVESQKVFGEVDERRLFGKIGVPCRRALVPGEVRFIAYGF